MKGNPISTFPPCYSFHIGEVIQTWLARLMRCDLGSSLRQCTQSLNTILYSNILISILLNASHLNIKMHFSPSGLIQNKYIFIFACSYIQPRDACMSNTNCIQRLHKLGVGEPGYKIITKSHQ